MDVSIPIPAYFCIALERGFFEKAKIPRSKDNFCGTTQKPLGGMDPEYNVGPQERFILPPTTAESTKARLFPPNIF